MDEFTIAGARVTASTVLSSNQPVTLTLRDIHLTGLGTGPEGITAADLRLRQGPRCSAALNDRPRSGTGGPAIER